jgi:hypothetical protein
MLQTQVSVDASHKSPLTHCASEEHFSPISESCVGLTVGTGVGTSETCGNSGMVSTGSQKSRRVTQPYCEYSCCKKDKKTPFWNSGLTEAGTLGMISSVVPEANRANRLAKKDHHGTKQSVDL